MPFAIMFLWPIRSRSRTFINATVRALVFTCCPNPAAAGPTNSVGRPGTPLSASRYTLGTVMLFCCPRLVPHGSTFAAARRVMKVSLVYLPALLLTVLDKA